MNSRGIMANPKISKGQLVIIGGSEDKEGDAPILREFVRRAGGIKAHICNYNCSNRTTKRNWGQLY